MKVISLRSMFFAKVVSPLIWVATIILIFIGVAANGELGKNPLILIWPVFVLAVSFVAFRKYTWHLADEVRDFGEYLIVRRGAIEDRVEISEIMNVNMTEQPMPPRLYLRLRHPGKFGDEIAFIPQRASAFDLFARNPIAEDLVQRVDVARQLG